jgi:hypothetical protein
MELDGIEVIPDYYCFEFFHVEYTLCHRQRNQRTFWIVNTVDVRDHAEQFVHE